MDKRSRGGKDFKKIGLFEISKGRVDGRTTKGCCVCNNLKYLGNYLYNLCETAVSEQNSLKIVKFLIIHTTQYSLQSTPYITYFRILINLGKN